MFEPCLYFSSYSVSVSPLLPLHEFSRHRHITCLERRKSEGEEGYSEQVQNRTRLFEVGIREGLLSPS